MAEKRSLCELVKDNMVEDNFKDYKKLVREGKYICHRCGRAARKKRNLCKPESL